MDNPKQPAVLALLKLDRAEVRRKWIIALAFLLLYIMHSNYKASRAELHEHISLMRSNLEGLRAVYLYPLRHSSDREYFIDVTSRNYSHSIRQVRQFMNFFERRFQKNSFQEGF